MAPAVCLRGWFKGADTVCLLDFLESFIGSQLDAMDDTLKPIFLESHATISAANAFMRCIYSAALWLSNDERKNSFEVWIQVREFIPEVCPKGIHHGSNPLEAHAKIPFIW